MSDKTYYYLADIRDAKQIVQIAVHFKNAFVGSDTNIATIDGIFQISDSTTPIKVDQQYDKMSIRTVDSSSLSITMDNKDNQVTLSKNKDILLMQDIHIKTADQEDISAENPLRYYIYEATTINAPSQLTSPNNYPPVITNFVSSNYRNIVPGESVIFTATVSDPDIYDQILYRFFLNGEPVTDWVPQSQWTWNTTQFNSGNYRAEVRAIDQKHAGQDSFDDRKTLEFNIAKLNNQPVEGNETSWRLLFLFILILIVISKMYEDKIDATVPKDLKSMIEFIIPTIITIIINLAGLESWNGVIIWLGLFFGTRRLISYIGEKSIALLIKFLASKPILGSLFAFVETLSIPHIINIPNGPVSISNYQFVMTDALKLISIITITIFNAFLLNKVDEFYDNFRLKLGISNNINKVILIAFALVLTFAIIPTQSNGPYPIPIITDLTSDTLGPQVGSSMIWTAVVSDPNNSHYLYRFFLNEKPETDWTHKDQWNWIITDANISENKVEVRVKDDRNANLGALEGKRSTICTISKPISG